MANRLEGKVAVVTGSGRGIGREIALLMAAEGAKVVVNDLGTNKDGVGGAAAPADEVVAEIRASGGVAVPNYNSVATAEGADQIVAAAIENFGQIDILVNNAGFLRDRMIWNMSDEEFDAIIKVHLFGPFYCTRAAIRHLRPAIKEGRQQGGRVINLTSASGIVGNAGQPNYSAAKAGVIGFTLSCAKAFASLGVTCNAVAPLAHTRLADTIPDDRFRELVKARGFQGVDEMPIEQVRKLYLGGSPAAIAPVVVWLCTDQASAVTGQVFAVREGAIAVCRLIEEGPRKERDGLFTVDELTQVMPSLLAGEHQKEKRSGDER